LRVLILNTARKKSKTMKQVTQKGFTLLEILLVVAAIAILAGIVIIAINPTKQLADTRNSQRRSDVNSILNGVYQWSIDNKGKLPSGSSASSTISTTTKEICSDASSTVCANANLIDLSALWSPNEKYLVGIPTDPGGNATTSGTGYNIYKSTNGRVTVEALYAEESATIKASK
jgi:prepilin-type N-terminal cleavage/methylation domain-containing protein